MAVIISNYATTTFGAAGSAFGSLLNVNITASLNKVLNADNYPILAGKLPGLAWLKLPDGATLEVTHDGGSSWWPAIGGLGSSGGSGIWFLDGFTSRTGGAASGNASVVFLNSQPG